MQVDTNFREIVADTYSDMVADTYSDMVADTSHKCKWVIFSETMCVDLTHNFSKTYSHRAGWAEYHTK